MHSKGVFYVVDYNGKVCSIDIQPPQPKETLVKARPPSKILNIRRLENKLYLVELFGELLQVIKIADQGNDLAARFHVFKLNSIEKNWIKVKTLGGHMIFVGYNSSFFISATNFPGLQSNCIYYASNYSQSSQGMLVFNVKNESFALHLNVESNMLMPPFIWIQPGSRQRARLHEESTGVLTCLEMVGTEFSDDDVLDGPIPMIRSILTDCKDLHRENDWEMSMKETIISQTIELMMELEKKSTKALHSFLSKIDLQREWSLSNAEYIQLLLKEFLCFPKLCNNLKFSINSLKETLDQGADLQSLETLINVGSKEPSCEEYACTLDNHLCPATPSRLSIVALRRRYWRRCVGNVAARLVTEGGSNQNARGLSYAGACTYCKTKHARGHLVSYTIESLVERVRNAEADGVKEIWISSEDTGAYGRDIEKVEALEHEMIRVRKKLEGEKGQSTGDLQSSHTPHSLSQGNYNAQSVSEVPSIADDEAQCKRKAKDTNYKLLSWKGLKIAVTHAQWVTKDPECMLYDQILGPNVCKVVVTNVVIPLFSLWRATDDTNTIGGALKSFIAWPKKFVVLKDN
ncbi:hypothetical protein GIB67_024391 [Kingdonia uniflora]|uniref:KIB1-4 beta-propeller domain-containing protein n=1 Tax=Kingdonia uniflora TaxID=39325 RepID=A0A7J7LF98_9MAGN|nr:hypothetical protein GIB67_024391 [Kingdonia uniflora]